MRVSEPSKAQKMENPLASSLWLAVAVYTAIGLIGVIVLRNTTPTVQDLTIGYGVGYSKIAASETAK